MICQRRLIVNTRLALVVLVLLARRRGEAIAWTAGVTIAIAVLAFWLVRPATFQSFVSYERPRLSHGDAFFSGTDAQRAQRLRRAAVNFSVFGASCRSCSRF